MIAAGIYLFRHKDYTSSLKVLKTPVANSNSTAELYTAFAFYQQKNFTQANYFLTRACTNKVKTKDIEAYCKNTQNVEKIDLSSDSIRTLNITGSEPYEKINTPSWSR